MSSEPNPGYFQFDHIIEQLPEIYHGFARSTLGLVERLCGRFNLQGSTLADICAGTGRCALTLASEVKHVYAVELQRGPSLFACEQLRERGVANVTYLRGDTNKLPLCDKSVDHAVGMWGEVNRREAERVVRPGGHVFLGGCAPGNLVGELSPMVGSLMGVPRGLPIAEMFFADAGPGDGVDTDGYSWEDFDYVADYGTPEEAARLYGRIYGPQVGQHLQDQRKSTVHWRLRLLSRQVDE